MKHVILITFGFLLGAGCVAFLNSGTENATAYQEPEHGVTHKSVEPTVKHEVPPETRQELARLRAEITQLRQRGVQLSHSGERHVATNRDQLPLGPQFRHRFLSRENWTNAGLGTPRDALETYLWAMASKNQSAITEASVTQADGSPVLLSGMSLDFSEALSGVQVLSFMTPNPDNPNVLVATMITETTRENETGPSVRHGVLRIQFENVDGAWKFAGKLR